MARRLLAAAAVDRGGARGTAADAAKGNHARPLSVCGEMAADPLPSRC
jgi:hypothetical protein